MIRCLVLLAIPAALAGQTPSTLPQALPDSERQAAIIDAVRQKAAQYVRDLPNFVCTQETVRERDFSATGEQWKLVDTLVEQLTYFDHSEKYQVMSINGRPPGKVSHETLRNLRSSGEFGSALNAIFRPKSKAEFQWERRDNVGSRPVDVIAYRVAKEFSGKKITWGKRSVVPGHHGWLYADAETGSVLRLVDVDEMPAGFPIQAANFELEYGWAEIAGQRYLLPVKSQVLIQLDKVFERNVIAFTGYRKFDAAASVKFDSETPDAAKKQP